MRNHSNSFGSNTSSFVNYTDYTNTSENNYINFNLYSRSVLPNMETVFAIEEARYNKNLKSYEKIEDLFSELEM